MKKIFLFSTLLLMSLPMFSQETENISFHTNFMIQNNQRVQQLQVEIPWGNYDFQDIFREWMNEIYDARMSGGKIIEISNSTLVATDCYIPEITNRRINLYMQIKNPGDPNKITLLFYASFGFDTWITSESHPFEFRSMTGVVKNFIYKYLYQTQLSPSEELSIQI